MSTHQVRSLAASAARTVGRRLRARRGGSAAPARIRGHTGPAPEARAQPEAAAIPLPQARARKAAESRAGVARGAATEPRAAAAEPGPGVDADAAGEPPADADGLEPRADVAELDALRGALVHELDRLAAGDECSASFRRAG